LDSVVVVTPCFWLIMLACNGNGCYSSISAIGSQVA